MANAIYLEVAKDTGAILSFAYEKLKSSTSDFVEATEAELSHLNHLEDSVFPAGTIATLSDLTSYRAKLKSVALARFNLAQSQGRLVKAEAAAKAARASMDTFMNAEAAKRGVSRAELESLLEARQKRIAAANESTNIQALHDDKARQSLIAQIKSFK